jgi:GTP-binding protein EngB required for normal cell division
MTIVERVSSVADAEKKLDTIVAEMMRVAHTKSLSTSEIHTKMDELEAEYGAAEDGLKSYKR